jgi:hypothetical protein
VGERTKEREREGDNNLGKKEVNIFNEIHSKVQDIKFIYLTSSSVMIL